MELPLNFGLLKHWENWVRVVLMVTIAMFAVHIVFGPNVHSKKETK